MDNVTTALPGSSGFGPILSMLAGLFLVIGVLMVGLYFLRRYGPKGLAGSKNLSFEGQIALGPRKSVVVVRFLNKVLVLGVTEQQINLLTEMEAGHDHETDFAAALEKSRKNDTA